MSDTILVIDTETTGMEPEQGAEVIQVAIRFGLDDKAETKLWNIRPLGPIPQEATDVHGIVAEDTLEWPTFGEVANEIGRCIHRAKAIAGYNPDYDIKMLKAEFKRARLKVTWPPLVICAKRLWDSYLPKPKRDLQNAYREFVDPNGFEGAHGALADARATAQVLRAQIERFNLKDKPLEEYDPERMNWWGPSEHVVWEKGLLVCNFGKNKGKPMHLLDQGMLKWIREKDFPPHVKELALELLLPRGQKSKERIGIDIAAWAKRY